jgi:hypothetical protein
MKPQISQMPLSLDRVEQDNTRLRPGVLTMAMLATIKDRICVHRHSSVANVSARVVADGGQRRHAGERPAMITVRTPAKIQKPICVYRCSSAANLSAAICGPPRDAY